MVLLRFAPSPTGSLHLGGLRTALFNHLFSRKHGGKWLLRIEDTDATRFVPGSVEGIIKALDWAGVMPDYGPQNGGPHGPYFQSHRLDLYKSYADRLLSEGRAYRCFCTADRLKETRERLSSLSSNATYDRHCHHLTDEEVARKVRAGEKHVVRLLDTAVPARASVEDMMFGATKDVRTSLPTDTILLKSDMFPTYHLASIVDDHEMGITHVIRGEEWLPSLPLHLDLYACFGLKPPTFGHLPLLLNADGTKMSKRAVGVHVHNLMDDDYEPEAVLNWLFALGLSTQPHEADLFSMTDMLQRFDMASFSNHRSILDRGKLLHLNRQHLLRKAQDPSTNPSLQARISLTVKSRLPAAGEAETQPEYAVKALNLAAERVHKLSDLPEVAPYLFVQPDYTTDEAQKLRFTISDDAYIRICDTAATHLAAQPDLTDGQPASDWWPAVVQLTKDEAAASNKHVMGSLRHALTGVQKGPPILDTVDFLGRQRVLERLRHAAATGGGATPKPTA